MDAVSWDLLEGETLEAVVGVLLSREFVDVDRVRPQQGDGGLDVIVRVGAGLYDVYQVKKFSRTLTSDQKTKIRKSLKRAIETHNDSKQPIKIRNWYITLPYQAMLPERKWLVGAAKRLGTPFPHEWRGLTFLDGLASTHPSVIDYYLRGGRQRLEGRIDALRDFRSLRELAGLEASTVSGQMLEPSDLVSGLQGVFKGLNEDDPHYRYEFEVTASMPEPASRPGLVMSSSIGTKDVCVTYHVIARYKTATDDRPILMNLQMNPEAMSDEDKGAWEQSIRYGDPVTIATGASVSLDAPAGLGGEFTDVRVMMSPSDSPLVTANNGVRWAMLDDDDRVLAELDMAITERSVGQAGGMRLSGTDYSDTLSFTLRIEPAGTEAPKVRGVTLRLEPRPFEELKGRYVDGVLPAFQFLAEMASGGRLALGPRFGDLNTDAATTLAETDLDVSGPLRVMTNLSELGKQIKSAQRVPDMDLVTEGQLTKLARAVAAGRGEPQLLRPDTLVVPCHPTFALELLSSAPQPRLVPIRYLIELGDDSIEVEHLAVYFERAYASLVSENDDRTTVEMSCDTDSAMRLCIAEQPTDANGS